MHTVLMYSTGAKIIPTIANAVQWDNVYTCDKQAYTHAQKRFKVVTSGSPFKSGFLISLFGSLPLPIGGTPLPIGGSERD